MALILHISLRNVQGSPCLIKPEPKQLSHIHLQASLKDNEICGTVQNVNHLRHYGKHEIKHNLFLKYISKSK